jgi:hypothetical protein
MDRLEKLGWCQMQIELQRDIMSVKSPGARRDLQKMETGLLKLATELSKAEVTERRTMGSSGRRCDELEQQLLDRYKYIQKMITIARLSF